MRKQLSALILGAAISVSSIAATANIGVVDVQSIFNQSSAVKATKARLQKEFVSKRKEVQASIKSLNAMMADYKKNASVMTADKKAAMQKQIAAKQSSIMQAEQGFQQQASDAEQKAMGKFVKDIQVAAAKVAKAKHLDVVLPTHGVLYAASTADITKAVQAKFKD